MADATARKAASELNALITAWGNCTNARYMRFETACAALKDAKFPYELVQEYDRASGRNTYRFAGKFSDDSAIFVNETEAGKPTFGVRRAFETMRRVLVGFAAGERKEAA